MLTAAILLLIIIVIIPFIVRRGKKDSCIHNLLDIESEKPEESGGGSKNDKIRFFPKLFFSFAASVLAILWFLTQSPGVVVIATGLLVIAFSTRADTVSNSVQIQQEIPLFLEKLIMAVQSGLDIPSGIHAVLNVDSGLDIERGVCATIFEDILKRVATGHTFYESIEIARRGAKSQIISHVLLHISVACREGGEVSAPLRELSETVQQSYEDAQEEWIARLPVKATLPLLLTFAGLLLLFLTAPLLQVLQMVDAAS